VKRLLDAKAIQRDYGLNRRQSYAVLSAVGVRISPRRIVALTERVEEFLRGGEATTVNGGVRGKQQAPGLAGA
jgi:hypothetical protein